MAESHQPTKRDSIGSPKQENNGSVAKSEGGDVDRENGAGALSDIKNKVVNAQHTIKTKYRVVSESADDFVHESPWKAIAMATVGGLIIGMLAAR